MSETMLMPVAPTPDPGKSDPEVQRAITHEARVSFLRRVLLESGYALSAFVLALPAFVLVVAGAALGIGTAVVAGVGVTVLVGTAYVARGFAHVERLRLRSMLGFHAPLPAYLRAAPGSGRVRALLTPLRDVQSWLDLLWCVLALVTGTLAFAVTLVWWAAVLNGASYWFWEQFVPRDPDGTTLASLIGLGESRAADVLVQTGIGLFALLTLPLAVRLAATVHGSVARVLLCSRVEMVGRLVRSEELRLSTHRAEAASLRKLERDIHDGPQQRLIRLGLDLGRARRHLADDPERAAATIDAALAQTRETVEELRALSRGIAPPLLVDRGLAVAVREMAEGQQIPVRATVDLPPRMEQALETTAYFVVAEALTNVVKHSHATRADVDLRIADGWLQVTVDDDGRGGARLAPGRGLDGLRERVAGMAGRLVVASPDGGPTRVRAEVPLR